VINYQYLTWRKCI